MTIDKVTREFSELETILLRETEREILEGDGHTGLGSVIQFIARRRG